jgi:uncharacterized protein (DUF362 family)
MTLSRRQFAQLAGAGLLLQSGLLKAQQVPGASAPSAAAQPQGPPTGGLILVGSKTSGPSLGPSKVALVHGDDRRKNVTEALLSIDDQVQAGLRRKKYVLIKPNIVATDAQLAATNVDALRGILDYLEPRFHGPVIIAEASARDTLEGYHNYKYDLLPAEYRSMQLSLLDLNREEKYQAIPLIDYDLHIDFARVAARFFDSDAYIISSAMLKTHNAVIATMSVKNMVLGSPLRSTPGQTAWSDKRKFHVGVRQMHVNMMRSAQLLRPNWGAAVIDGFDGMEGNGPHFGTPVSSRIAIASTDYVAADRVALEAMGINPDWIGYLKYCGQVGLGQYDLSKIEIVGAAIASVQKKYQLNPDIETELQWMGPMQQIPPSLASLHELHEREQLDLTYGC